MKNMSFCKVIAVIGITVILFFPVLSVANAAGEFTDSGISFPGSGSLAWGDYDNDGDLDLAISGSSNGSRIYKNNGNNTFTDIGAGFPTLAASAVAWGDYDNDGDLDLAMCGLNVDIVTITKIYKNNGNNTFTDINAQLIGVTMASLAWGDYDNDGDLDLAICGYRRKGSLNRAYITRIYRNNGDNTFTDINAGIPNLDLGLIAWGDYDDDGDLDFAISGNAYPNGPLTRIYKNNGNSTFTDINAGLTKVFGSPAWGDYDNDGDLDLVVSGNCGNTSAEYITKIYRNDGSNKFTNIQTVTGLAGSVSWGDYDNDGDLDLAVCGAQSGVGAYITRIYKNNGNNTFTDINAGLPGVSSSVAWGDYDNDGDLDLVLCGKPTHTSTTILTKIYKNNLNKANTVPFAPANLTYESETNNSTILKWATGYDVETPEAGLYYNLRVGTSPGAEDIVSGVYGSPLLGNYLRPKLTSEQLGVRLKGLPVGQYYWSVQTIDTSLKTSTAPGLGNESTFFVLPTISGKVTLPSNSSVVWVKVPEVNPETATTIYMYYDNPSAEDDQNRESVWDNGYVGVWHMGETSWNGTAGEVVNSAQNAYHGIAKNAATTSPSGKIGYAGNFNGGKTNANQVEVSNFSNALGTDYSISYWAYAKENDINQGVAIGPSYAVHDFEWFQNGTALNVRPTSGSSPSYGFANGFPTNKWTYISGKGNSTTTWAYINGAPVGSSMPYGKGIHSGYPLQIGAETGEAGDGFNMYGFYGLIDEVRISNITRSDAWIKAEYNSTNDSLISFGEEEIIYGNPWHYRRAIYIDPTKIDETLSNFPLCIKLDSSRITYTGSNGQDIRFTDTLGNLLYYEIEYWSEGAPASDTRDATDVVLTLAGPITETAYPDTNGNYSFIDLNSGVYTITPTLTDYYFIPASRSYSNIDSNQINQDFTAVYNPLLSSWTKKKPLTISGSTIDLTDYQVKVNVEYESDMQPDFDDLRFVDNSENILDYWIESYAEYETATVWVKIPSIPTTGTTIDMYYGNPEATSASNGDNTFIFFDDFNGTSGSDIDTTKWVWTNQSNNRATYDNTYAHSGGTSMKLVSSYPSGGQPYHYFGSAMSNAELTAWVYDAGYNTTREAMIGENYFRNVGIYSLTSSYYRYRIVESPTYYNNTTVLRKVGWHKIQMRCDGTNTSFYIDGILVATVPGMSSFSQVFVGNSHYNPTTDYFDDVSVRKYNSPEPTATVGKETE